MNSLALNEFRERQWKAIALSQSLVLKTWADPSRKSDDNNLRILVIMSTNDLLIYTSALEYAIDRDPLIVTPETPIADVLALMSQIRSSCPLPNPSEISDSSILHRIRASCALVMAPSHIPRNKRRTAEITEDRWSRDRDSNAGILGIFTERDIVRLTATGQDFKHIPVSKVMRHPVITLSQADSRDIFTALSLFRQHRIRHLPIVDREEKLIGMVTPETIRQALQPANILTRLRYVKDVMSQGVIQALPEASVLDLAQQMAEHRVSCIVITQTNHEPYKMPIGIVTERDIVQFQALEIDLNKLKAKDVMSSPLFCLSPADSLWFAHQEMQQRHVRRMVVTGPQGELIGIVSQTSLLQALEPTEMYGVIEALQQAVEGRTSELQIMNEQLQSEIGERERAELELKKAHDNLQKLVDERTAQLQAANEKLKQDLRERKRVEAALRQSEAELRQQAQRLKNALQELQQTQTQLIQAEKMSSLGQLVAGIAHEINNPVNFIYGNLDHASHYIEDLVQLIHLYEQQYPHQSSVIEEFTEAIDLDFLIADLPKLLHSMQQGAERIRQIVLSLRNFSRLDEAEIKRVNLHDGLDSTLLILQHRLKGKPGHVTIDMIKDYGELPLVECYAGPLNQVFMNLLSNAIDALEEKALHLGRNQDLFKPRVRIRTGVKNTDQVAIAIADNGCGMTEAVRQRLFEPFFTTKTVGKGTGLGLSISYQIVVEKHRGKLQCISTPGEGTEFLIEIPIHQNNPEPPVIELNASDSQNPSFS